MFHIPPMVLFFNHRLFSAIFAILMISGGALTFITTANAAPPSDILDPIPDDSEQGVLNATPIECSNNEQSGSNYTISIEGCPPNNVTEICFKDTESNNTCKITTCTGCDVIYDRVNGNVPDDICGFTVQRQTCVIKSCTPTTTYSDWQQFSQPGYEYQIVTRTNQYCVVTQETQYRCAIDSGYTGTANCYDDPDQPGVLVCEDCYPINNPDNPSTCIQCPDTYANFSQLECFDSESDRSTYCYTTCSVPCTTIGQNYCENPIDHKYNCTYNENDPNLTQSGVKFYTPDNSGFCQESATVNTRIVAKKCTVHLTCNTGYHVVNNDSLAPYCTGNIYTVTVDVRPQLLLDGTDPGLRITPTTFYYKYNTDAYYSTNNDSQLSNPINNNNLTVYYVDPNDSANFNFSGLYEINDPEKKILVNATGKIVSPGENIAALYQRLNNTTLYPKITAKNFTVSFDPNGGNVGKASFQYTFSKTKPDNKSCAYPGTTNYETINKCTIPTKQYNEFKGYYEDIDNGQQYYTDTCNLTSARIICRHSGDLSLKAKWQACMECAPGTGATCGLSVVSNKCTYDTDCTRGYHDIQNPGEYNPYCKIIEYTVEYLSNCSSGATGSTAQTEHIFNIDKELRPNDFTCGKNEFQGWSRTSTGPVEFKNKDTVKELTEEPNGTVNLYAIWESCTECAPGTGATCNLTAPLGVCNYDTDCTTGYHGITGDRTPNPSCSINTYRVEYYGNGNTDGTMSPSEREYNDGGTLTRNAFTKTGYSFAGWNTKDDGTGTAYDNLASGNLTKEHGKIIKLYAQWTANDYTVTYSCGEGATGSPATTTDTATYNEKYEVKGMGSCAKSGNTFNGWRIKDTETIYKPGKEFIWTYPDHKTMIVEWKPCPAGYWCPDQTNINPCPLGSTSNPGVTQKTDCFLQGGKSKICSYVNGTKKCYPLPNGVQAFYSGQ